MIIRMAIAVVLSTVIGVGVWQGTNAVWSMTSSNDTKMTASAPSMTENVLTNETEAEAVNVSVAVESNTVATTGLTPIQRYKARRYGLIVGLISLPFLLLILLPLGREPEEEAEQVGM